MFRLKLFFKSFKFNYKILTLLIFTDLAFVILHIFDYLFTYKFNYDFTGMGMQFMNMLFSLESDYSYAEFYQYIKEFWVCIIFLYLSIKNKNLSYFIWFLFFLYLLIDDSLSFHENAGEYLVIELNLDDNFGLRALDFGELIISITFGILFLILFFLSHYLTKFRALKETLQIGALVLVLVFFGVIVDMLHIIITNWLLYNTVGLIEDGGEMIAMSLITSFTFYLFLLKKESV